jgi:hypothetical protein
MGCITTRHFKEDYMARKRISKDSDKSETPTQFPEPTVDTVPTSEVAATAVLEPPTTPALEPLAVDTEPGFVEKLARQRNPGIVPDPFGIAGDYEAGVRLFENRRDRLMVIKFEQKPSSEVLTRMKDGGFRWNPRDQVWVHPIYPDQARQIRIEAERTYQDVTQMIRQERGLSQGPEVPF